MSKVIEFNAREFRFDDTCRSLDGGQVNAGMKAYITMSFGNAEVWEIGDWRWTWSQIRRDIKLEKNTDYVFRFSMEGGVCDTDNAVAIAHIAPKKEWEDRYSYILDHNKFMPVICKQDGKDLLRIFELPFNTGEDEEWIIYLVAQHAVTRYFAPVDISLIEDMPDVSYDDWWDKSRRKKREGMSGNNAVDGITTALTSAELDENEFAARLRRLGNNCNAAFESVTVYSSAVNEISVGVCSVESNIAFINCTLTSRAMSMIIAKLGDECNAAFENVTVTEDGINDLLDAGQVAFGMNIALENVTVPSKVYSLLEAKLAEDCNMTSENITIVNVE